MNHIRNYYHNDSDIMSVDAFGLSPVHIGQKIGIYRFEQGEVVRREFTVIDMEITHIIGELQEVVTIENIYLEARSRPSLSQPKRHCH